MCVCVCFGVFKKQNCVGFFVGFFGGGVFFCLASGPQLV